MIAKSFGYVPIAEILHEFVKRFSIWAAELLLRHGRTSQHEKQRKAYRDPGYLHRHKQSHPFCQE
jgi:hypothetical protein